MKAKLAKPRTSVLTFAVNNVVDH